jgi:iron complex outermembrane receptor protein
VALIPSTYVFAEEVDPFALSPEQLFGATVTSATRTSEKVWDVPAAIYVLSNEDIMRSGATSIPEALRLVPGVEVARINSGGWAVSVRGFNGALANKLLVLMDGREVYDPLFSGVYWDIQDTMLEDIDRIEVIRGPGASLWGANAVNGVINIITKTAAETQGNLASATIGNREQIGGERYGGTFGENGHYRVYGKYVDRDDSKTLSGANAEDQQIAKRAGFRTDWSANDNSFTVQGDTYDSNDGQLRNVPIIASPPGYLPPYSTLVDENIEAHGGNVLGRWTRSLANGSKLTTQSYLDYTSRAQQLVTDERATFDLDSQLELPQQDRHSIVIGGRYRYSHDDLGETGNILTFADGTYDNQLFSAFVQDKITLDPKHWYLTLGSKLEHNDYTGVEIEPNARLQWHPDDVQMVWASVSRAVRTPSRLEHDIEAVQVAGAGLTLDTLPNPDLNSEELIAYELGYRRQLTADAQIDIATFYNDYTRLTTYTFQSLTVGSNPTHLILGYEPLNNTKGQSYGVETSVDWHVYPSWRLSASYSLLELALQGPNVPPLNALGAEAAQTQSPQQQFNIRSQWDVNKAVTFDTTLYYVDSLPYYQLPSYWRLDARLGWKVMKGLDFNLVGQNLLDGSHREFGGPTDINTTDIERSVFGQFVWHF